MSYTSPRYVSPLIEFGPSDSPELTQFDNAVVGDHVLVDPNFYPMIFDSGAIVRGHRNERNEIVSVAALYPHSLNDPEAPLLERHLPKWAAMADGGAVRTDYRSTQLGGRSLHREHFDWRIEKAKELGKSGLITTARSDNLPTQRNMRACGCFGAADAPEFFSPTPEGDRVVHALLFDVPNTFSRSLAARESIAPEIVESAIAANQDAVTLGIRNNGTTTEFRRAVGKLLRNQYLEYSCLDAPGVNPTDPARLCWMSFRHLRTFPLGSTAKARLATAQGELQELCNPRLD